MRSERYPRRSKVNGPIWEASAVALSMWQARIHQLLGSSCDLHCTINLSSTLAEFFPWTHTFSPGHFSHRSDIMSLILVTRHWSYSQFPYSYLQCFSPELFIHSFNGLLAPKSTKHKSLDYVNYATFQYNRLYLPIILWSRYYNPHFMSKGLTHEFLNEKGICIFPAVCFPVFCFHIIARPTLYYDLSIQMSIF